MGPGRCSVMVLILHPLPLATFRLAGLHFRLILQLLCSCCYLKNKSTSPEHTLSHLRHHQQICCAAGQW